MQTGQSCKSPHNLHHGCRHVSTANQKHSLHTVPCPLPGTTFFGESLDETASFVVLSAAADHGICHWDTAEAYPVPPSPETHGLSEAILGAWLQGRPREKFRVTTKVSGPGSSGWLRGGPERLDGANITAALEGSLRRLRTDYVDLLLLHWPDRRGAALPCPACNTQLEHAHACAHASRYCTLSCQLAVLSVIPHELKPASRRQQCCMNLCNASCTPERIVVLQVCAQLWRHRV